MSEIQPFDIAGSGVRFGTAKDGRPYAVAADFTKVMGYRQASDATRLLDEDEKGQQIVLTLGGSQKMNVIYEDGMWELIFRSSLPGAKAIKKRVKEILRQIRETGRYAVESVEQPAIPEDYSGALRRLADEHDARILAENQRDALKPLAEAYADLMEADGTFDWAAVAQIFARITGGLGRNNFLDLLRSDDLKILKANNTPYQFKGMDRFFKVIPTKAGRDATPTTRVTADGLDWLRKRLIKHFNHQSTLFAIGEIA
ncbi:BRO family protein [Nonomuraea sp. NPDC049655]|uniref:BRO family protein n=1 Tax=Nonomuraea sp. NPDC049655 TaxID=3364355 RepID=UPI0037B7CD31